MRFNEIDQRMDKALRKHFNIGDVFTIWDVRERAGIPGKYWHNCIQHIDYLIIRGYIEFDGKRNRFKNSKRRNFYRLVRKPDEVMEEKQLSPTSFLDTFFNSGRSVEKEMTVSYNGASYTFNYPTSIKNINQYSNAELIAELNRRIG
jgi:hypothetical protein